MLSRALWGAGIGAAIGGLTQGNLGGMLGGAAGGAALGAGGGRISDWATGKGWSIAGFAQKGLSRGMKYTGKVSRAAMGRSSARMVGKKLVQGPRYGLMSNAAFQTARGAQGAVGYMRGAKRWIGNNTATVNKYGGYALGVMGAGAAASIGSSALSSNSGGY